MESARNSNRRAVIELIDATIASRRAPGTVAVEGVDWTVEEEDFWVIGGLLGSGKSDLLATAAALTKPTRGTYRLFGQDISPTYDNECLTERLRVGLVFGEGGRLFNQLTIWGNVALPLQYHQATTGAEGEMDERIAALLETLDLSDHAHHAPSSLGLGWRQRTALARALTLKPEVLLLDNPLAGLDPRHARWWIDFLFQLSAGHAVMDGQTMTIVVAVDDPRPWQQPGNRFALLHETRFTLLNDVQEFNVLESPAPPHGTDLL
ncbi:MAG: ATP-binding cassette domain-containing protein [Verrucomicrobia bacterium]|nr:ATP-binding cassette domain-containing protein [Verrucomicrobiota bacterium]